MIHIWLDAQQNKFRVWDSQSTRWFWIDSLSELNTATFIKAGEEDICLYLPTQKVLSLDNELSIAQIKQLGDSGQQYLFEDLSLMPVESLNVRYMSHGTNRYFYALSEAEIEQWQQSAVLAGYKLVALLPDFLLLPVPDKDLQQQVVLCQFNQTPVLNRQNSSNLDVNNLNQDHPNPDVYDTSDSNTARFLARFNEAQGVEIGHSSLLSRLLNNIEEIVYIDSAHLTQLELTQVEKDTKLKPSALNHTPLQLLADERGIVITPSAMKVTPVSNPVKHDLNFVELSRSRLASPHLMMAAGVLVAALVVQVGADALQWYQYEKAASQTQQAIEEQFSSWFSGERLNPKVDVTAQVKPRLIADESQQQQQLSLMNQVAPLIKQSQVVAKSLQWDENNIVLVVQGENRAGIDQLQQGLIEQGLTANLGSVTPAADNQVNGEFRIALENSIQN